MPVQLRDELQRRYWLIFVGVTETGDRQACGRWWDDKHDEASEGRSVLRRRRAVLRWFYDMRRMQTGVLVSWFTASGCLRTGNLNGPFTRKDSTALKRLIAPLCSILHLIMPRTSYPSNIGHLGKHFTRDLLAQERRMLTPYPDSSPPHISIPCRGSTDDQLITEAFVFPERPVKVSSSYDISAKQMADPPSTSTSFQDHIDNYPLNGNFSQIRAPSSVVASSRTESEKYAAPPVMTTAAGEPRLMVVQC